jgi:hypothetical protein
MTAFFEQALPRRDVNANALLALTILLILTTWSFFGRFSIVAAAAGIATSICFGGGTSGIPHPPSAVRTGGRRC